MSPKAHPLPAQAECWTIGAPWLLPQVLAEVRVEPKPQEANPPTEAAARAEPKKERAPRMDWAKRLRRTFELEVCACPGVQAGAGCRRI